jgi:Tol biopolymer transport system component
LAAAALVAALAASTSAEAAFPGRNGEIAFTRNVSGATDIFAVDPDGRHLRRLTRGVFIGGSLDFSPDGRKLAFSRYCRACRADHIWVMDADGRRQRELTHGRAYDGNPSFSADGRRILFYRSTPTGIGSGLYLMHVDGTHLRALGQPERRGQAWLSPSVATLVFASNGIRTMRLDGSHLRRLTRIRYQPPDPADVVYPYYGDTAPSYSPDGRRVVFLRIPDQSVGIGSVYVVDADGSHVRELCGFPSWTCASNADPIFSPDGRKVAFTGSDGAIHVMNSDGTKQRRLRHTLAGSFELTGLAWQPITPRFVAAP